MRDSSLNTRLMCTVFQMPSRVAHDPAVGMRVHIRASAVPPPAHPPFCGRRDEPRVVTNRHRPQVFQELT
jgi:hypothetical protein